MSYKGGADKDLFRTFFFKRIFWDNYANNTMGVSIPCGDISAYFILFDMALNSSVPAFSNS